MKIGLDLGSASLKVACSPQGVILREASLVADNLAGGPSFVIGQAATDWLDRTPQPLQTISPISKGVVSAPLAAGVLLKAMLTQAIGWKTRLKPHVITAVPARITDSQQTALRRALAFAGFSRVTLVAKPLAAALGVKEATKASRTCTIVDIGAETTEVSTLSPGIVVSESLPLGGRNLSLSIVDYLRDQHHLDVDEGQAERVKLAIGSAHFQNDGKTSEVFGRERLTGLPQTITLTSRDLQKALAPVLIRTVELIKQVLNLAPPGLSQDILRQGVILTGCGALLHGLDRYLCEHINLAVRVADSPGDCVALGLLQTTATTQNTIPEDT